MIRSQWRCTATALPLDLRLSRFFSQTLLRAEDQPWPLLKRRSPASSVPPLPRPIADALQPAAVSTTGRKPSDPRLMLTVHGLSTNLNPSDFYRLAPRDLSAWQDSIKKVQQVRHPKTLEPSGTYLVTFSSPEAAIAYRENVLRLHRLSRLKALSPDGLWERSIPLHLRSPDQHPEQEIQAFTLAPGSQVDLTIDRKRVQGVKGWAPRLSEVLQPLGYGAQPPTVLLEVYPPTLNARDLSRIIESDGHSRGCDWDTCYPIKLDGESGERPDDKAADQRNQRSAEGPPGEQAEDQPDHQTECAAKEQPEGSSELREKRARTSRFAIVCSTDAEARRFHRFWNHKQLERFHAQENIVYASIIKW